MSDDTTAIVENASTENADANSTSEDALPPTESSITVSNDGEPESDEGQEKALPVKVGRPLLRKLENTISQGYRNFWAVGEALLEIREQNLYAPRYSGKDYGSFVDYLRDRWGYTSRGYQLLEATQVRRTMIEIGIRNPDSICVSERQYREQSGILKLADSEKMEKLKEYVAENRKSLSVEGLRETVQQLLPPPPARRAAKAANSARSLEKKLEKLKHKFETSLASFKEMYPDHEAEILAWQKELANSWMNS